MCKPFRIFNNLFKFLVRQTGQAISIAPLFNQEESGGQERTLSGRKVDGNDLQ